MEEKPEAETGKAAETPPDAPPQPAAEVSQSPSVPPPPAAPPPQPAAAPSQPVAAPPEPAVSPPQTAAAPSQPVAALPLPAPPPQPAAPPPQALPRPPVAPAASHPPEVRTERARGPRPEMFESREPLYRESGGYTLRIDPADLARLRELPGSKGKTDRELGELFLDGHAARLTGAVAGDVPVPSELRVVVDPYSRQAFLALGKTIRGIVSF